jgi:hypothetical protein
MVIFLKPDLLVQDNFQCCSSALEPEVPNGVDDLPLVSQAIFPDTELTEHGKKPKFARDL